MLPVNSEYLGLKRGSLFFDRFENGQSTGFRFVGNCEALERTMEDDTLEFRGSTLATRPVAKKITRERTIQILATMNEFQAENIALHFMGDVETSSVVAAPGTSVAIAGVKAGRHYKTGHRNITNVTVSDGSTPYTVDDDYTVLSGPGLIYIVPGGAMDGAGPFDIDVTLDAPAGSLERIRGALYSTIEGSLLYIEDNASGPSRIYEAWKVSVTPQGAHPFVTDEWGSFQLAFEALDDSANHPSEPIEVSDLFTPTA